MGESSKLKNDVSVRVFDSCKGDIATVRISSDFNFINKIKSDYVKLTFDGDILYLDACTRDEGFKLSGANKNVLQISRKSVVDMLKCFEGEYVIRRNIKEGRYYITYSDRMDITRNSAYGEGTTGNRHSDTPRGRNSGKVKDVDASAVNSSFFTHSVNSDLIATTMYDPNTIVDAPEKPYASAITKLQTQKNSIISGSNRTTIETLLKLAISQIDAGNSSLAKATLLTVQEVMKI